MSLICGELFGLFLCILIFGKFIHYRVDVFFQLLELFEDHLVARVLALRNVSVLFWLLAEILLDLIESIPVAHSMIEHRLVKEVVNAHRILRGRDMVHVVVSERLENRHATHRSAEEFRHRSQVNAASVLFELFPALLNILTPTCNSCLDIVPDAIDLGARERRCPGIRFDHGLHRGIDFCISIGISIGHKADSGFGIDVSLTFALTLTINGKFSVESRRLEWDHEQCSSSEVQ